MAEIPNGGAGSEQTNRLLGEVLGYLKVLDQKVGGLDQKVGGLDQKVSKIDQKVSGLDARVGGLEGRFDGLEQRFDKLERRFDGLAADQLSTRTAIMNRIDRVQLSIDAMRDDAVVTWATADQALTATETLRRDMEVMRNTMSAMERRQRSLTMQVEELRDRGAPKS